MADDDAPAPRLIKDEGAKFLAALNLQLKEAGIAVAFTGDTAWQHHRVADDHRSQGIRKRHAVLQVGAGPDQAEDFLAAVATAHERSQTRPWTKLTEFNQDLPGGKDAVQNLQKKMADQVRRVLGGSDARARAALFADAGTEFFWMVGPGHPDYVDGLFTTPGLLTSLRNGIPLVISKEIAMAQVAAAREAVEAQSGLVTQQQFAGRVARTLNRCAVPFKRFLGAAAETTRHDPQARLLAEVSDFDVAVLTELVAAVLEERKSPQAWVAAGLAQQLAAAARPEYPPPADLPENPVGR